MMTLKEIGTDAAETAAAPVQERNLLGGRAVAFHHSTNRSAGEAFTSLDIDPREFWRRVDTSDPDGCWPWTMHRLNGKYGQWSVKRRGASRSFYAHRVALELSEGRLLGPG